MCQSSACVSASSAMTAAIDPSVDPCNNFYNYACGRWIRTHPIPDALQSWAVFNEVERDTLIVVKNILGM